MGMKVEPASDGVDPKIVVDVRVHRNGISGVYDGIVRKGRESF